MVGVGRSLWKFSGPTHCSHSSVPGITSNRPITEKAYKDALAHFQAKILPRFPLSKLNIYMFLYTGTQDTQIPQTKEVERKNTLYDREGSGKKV